MTAGLSAHVGNLTTLVRTRETAIRVKMRTKSRQIKREDEYLIFTFMRSYRSVNKQFVISSAQHKTDEMLLFLPYFI